jgi:hypothetical protein
VSPAFDSFKLANNSLKASESRMIRSTSLSRTGNRPRHDEAPAKLISKTRPEMHTNHCVLEKDSLNPLRFAK